jgi:hypothetical protein
VPAAVIEPEGASNVLVGVHVNPELRLVSSTVSSIMHFGVKEMKGGKVVSSYNDEYQLEDFTIAYSEYFTPTNWCKK